MTDSLASPPDWLTGQGGQPQPDHRLTGQGRAWAYAGAILGGAVSIAANVAHSYVPPTPAKGMPPIPPDWSPQSGAVIGAVFWPVALFVAIEILARVAWPDRRRWVALRYLGLLPVAVVAAVVSYRHLAGLLTFYGEDSLTVAIGPLAVDGLMIMATGALIATRRPLASAVPVFLTGQPDHRPVRDYGDQAALTGQRDQVLPPVTDRLTEVTPDRPAQPSPSVADRPAGERLTGRPDRSLRVVSQDDEPLMPAVRKYLTGQDQPSREGLRKYLAGQGTGVGSGRAQRLLDRGLTEQSEESSLTGQAVNA